jgi:hypothetical protein
MNQKKERKNISHKKIAKYWEGKIPEWEIATDFDEAEFRCWGCGYRPSDKKRLQKCHIVPIALGGVDNESNMVLLCYQCHLENPNTTDQKGFFDWLKGRVKMSKGLYDTYWYMRGHREYHNMYGTEFMDDLLKAYGHDKKSKDADIIYAQILKDVKEISTKEIKAINHNSKDYNPATYAVIFRKIVEKKTC